MENVEIHLPLSYGNGGTDHINDYPRMVEEYAKILFPNKVKVLKKLISKWDYDVFLSTIDIAILGAPRQNALGNIIRLLYMGKKVYLAPDNPLFYFLKEKFFLLNFQYLGKEKNVETVKKCRLKILEKIIWLLYNRACAKEKGGVKNFGKISRSIW